MCTSPGLRAPCCGQAPPPAEVTFCLGTVGHVKVTRAAPQPGEDTRVWEAFHAVGREDPLSRGAGAETRPSGNRGVWGCSRVECPREGPASAGPKAPEEQPDSGSQADTASNCGVSPTHFGRDTGFIPGVVGESLKRSSFSRGDHDRSREDALQPVTGRDGGRGAVF